MIVLASGSPRRRALLAQAGYRFEHTSADIDESVHLNEDAETYILRVSREKAEAVRTHLADGAVIITADTSVIDDGEILGKPADEIEAVAMLQRLRGHAHHVMTAFTVLDTTNGELQQQLISTEVVMRNYSDDEIHNYVATGDPFDKAGGYAIQHEGFAPVEQIVGCYANVVGLPLCRLVSVLEKLGHHGATAPNCVFPQHCAVQPDTKS